MTNPPTTAMIDSTVAPAELDTFVPNDQSKKASNYLQTSVRELQTVFAKLKELTLINEKVSTYLDPNFAMFCQVANITANRLVLVVANGSIATQIRFQTLDLLRRFKQDPALAFIREIQCKVRPPYNPSEAAPAYTRPPMEALSPQTAEMISEVAQSITDPRLREIMNRIARRTKK